MLKVNVWKNIFHASGSQKRAELAIFISGKKNRLNLKTVKRHKEGYYVMIKKSTHQEDRIMKKIYVPPTSENLHMLRILTYQRGVINNNAIILEDINMLI